MGSSRYSPAVDTVKKLHIEAASIRGDMPGQADAMANLDTPGQ